MARNPLDQFIGLRPPKKRKPMEFEGLDFTEPEQPGTMELPEMDFSEPQDEAPAAPTPEDRLKDPAYIAQYRKALEAKKRIDEGDQEAALANEAAPAGLVTRKPLDASGKRKPGMFEGWTQEQLTSLPLPEGMEWPDKPTGPAAFARQYFGRNKTADTSAEVPTPTQGEHGTREAQEREAAPDEAAAIRHFEQVPNVFLASRGMPQQPLSEDPMRRWLLQRGTPELAERRRLQNETMRAQLEKMRQPAEQKAPDELKAARTERELAAADRERAMAEKARRPAPVRPVTAGKTAPSAAGPSVAERRLQMRAKSLAPPPGWETDDPEGIAFRDPAQGRKFDDLEASFEALKNHREHALDAIGKLRSAKTVQEKDRYLAEANQQMQQIASKLRSAEGLPLAEGAQHAVEDMLSLKGGSILTLRNLANPDRLEAILNSALTSAGANLDKAAAQRGMHRKGAKSGAPKAAAPPPGRVHVRQGLETREIDEDDLEDAQADGWERVS